MKKVKFEGRLSLNKETVSKLNEKQMSSVKGGWTHITLGTCGCIPPTSGCPDPVTKVCATI